jgi:O-antigen/teichoic acid export membrane protein
MTFLSLMTAALAPLSTVMLPTATRVKIQGRAGELRPWIARFGIAAAVAGTALALVVAWQAPLVIRFFLGTTFLPYAALLRWTAIAIPGWALFVSFRSMVDAFYARAITSVSACIALALLVVIGAVTWRAGVGAVPLVVGLGATMLLLGLATSVAAIRGAVHPELPVSAVRP